MVRTRTFSILAALGIAAAMLQACAAGPARSGAPGRTDGLVTSVGDGTVTGYAEFDDTGAPRSIGIAFSEEALATLPSAHSDGHHCFDHNRDGRMDTMTECFASHEWIVQLPREVASRADMPFKWVLLNWNPGGHIPPGVYDKPHFDVHFYMQRIEEVFAISPGTCGPEFVRCDQFEIAKKPLPPNYMPPDYADVDAVVPGMGNHLIDLTGPEFQGEPFTRTWIYGIYDGRMTFYEEMLTLDHLRSRPNACAPLKTPPAVGVAGYYPTRSCIQYDMERDQYTVSLEGFVHRQASPPDPIPQIAAGEP